MKSECPLINIVRMVWCSILLSAAPVHSVQAATDGTLGTTSTGTLDMSLTVSNLFKVVHLADLSFGTYSGSGGMSLNRDVCVWTNVPTGTYKVKLRGDGTAGAFTLSNGAGSTLPYAVRWNAASGTSGNFSVNADELSAALTGANTSSTTCGGGDNANYQVSLTAQDLLATRPGTYTGVLTVIISP